MKRYRIPGENELLIRVDEDGIVYLQDSLDELDYKSDYPEHIVGWGNGGAMCLALFEHIEGEFNEATDEPTALWQVVENEETAELVRLVELVGTFAWKEYCNVTFNTALHHALTVLLLEFFTSIKED